MCLINPDILNKRMAKAKTFNQKMMVKLLALRQIGKVLGYYENNPYTLGQLPYDTELIEMLISRMHIKGMPLYIYVATAELLDYYCPFWRSCVDPKILGIITSRNDISVRKWRKEVLIRDKKSCVDCGSPKNIQAHHILLWSEFPEGRIDVDNGITLCGKCHSKQHNSMSVKMFYN